MDPEISIRPGVGMLALFPHMKYQPWYALGELVDNAIQSFTSQQDSLLRLHPTYRLRVEIEMSREDGGSIVVRDNAAGIASADWARALRVAEPPEDATGLSQFGVGMKAACCWFSQRWTLRSTALGEDVERSITFDVPSIVASGDETVTVHTKPCAPEDHYTVLEMSNLHRPVQARTLGKIRSYLGGIYRQFLRDSTLHLVVNGEDVRYDEPAILEAPLYSAPEGEIHPWREDVDLTLDSGKRVRGFVAIRETGDARQAGLALFYRGKVVTGSGEEVYKPDAIFRSSNSFESQRVFGELHMDDFAVTYTKDALVWHDEEDEFIAALRSALNTEPWPLLKQAREYRKRSPELPSTQVASATLDNITACFEAVGFTTPPVPSPHDSAVAPARPLGTDDAPAEPPGSGGPLPSVTRSFPIDVGPDRWTIDLRLIADSARMEWLHTRREGQTLQLIVNQAHPFMRAFCELPSQELEPVWRVAVALGLATELTRAEAGTPGRVVTHVNALLRDVLARKG